MFTVLYKSFTIYRTKKLFVDVPVSVFTKGKPWEYFEISSICIWVYNPWNYFAHRQLVCIAICYCIQFMSQLKLGNVWVIFSNFQNRACYKNIWKILKTIASIWHENKLRYLSLDIICSTKLTVFWELRAKFSENCLLLRTDNVHGQILVVF